MSITKPDQTLTSFLADFLAAVRAELSDLSVEERAEITDGLEADLAELVAERGPGALGDPGAYARELRSAAGIPERGSTASSRRPARELVTLMLDRSHAFADRQIDKLPGDPQPLLEWLRPAWWLARGVAAGGAWAWMSMRWGVEAWLVTVVVAAISVQVGRGKLWPGSRRGVIARLVLVVANGAAAIGLVLAANAVADVGHDSYWNGYDQAMNEQQLDDSGDPVGADKAGIYSDGHWVSQIFPYDAAGKPLVGVQLFDQTGKPIQVVTQPECESPPGFESSGDAPTTQVAPPADPDGYCVEQQGMTIKPRIYYPWTNGAAQLYNVFPLTSRYQDQTGLSATAFAEQDPPSVGTLPFATVPPISLPGVVTSQVIDPAAQAAAAAGTKKGATTKK